MATTNAQIIETYKTAHNIPLSTPLYTYAAWRSMGYQVRKGEKCRHRVCLWKYGEKKIEQEGQEKTVRRCFHKTMSLFEMSQVERMI